MLFDLWLDPVATGMQIKEIGGQSPKNFLVALLGTGGAVNAAVSEVFATDSVQ